MPEAGDPRWDALTGVLTLGNPATTGSAVGRHDMVGRLFDMVSTPGSHAIIVGEPGLGKTSLLNVVTDELRGAGVLVLRAEAEPGMSFDALLRAAAAAIRVAPDDDMRFAPAGPDAADAEPLSELLPEGEADPTAVAELLDQQLAGRPVLILDRYDAVGTGMTDRAVADLIKALSERSAQATVILAGNADAADDIHENHDRTFRYITEMPLRLLRPNEVFFLLDRMRTASGIGFHDDARKLILTASLGIPRAVQTLGRSAIGAALDAGLAEVAMAQAVAAMPEAAEAVDAETRQAVDMIVGDDPEDEFARLIFAVAAAHTDWYGRFFKPQVLQSIRQRFPDLEMGEDEVIQTLDSLCGDDSMSLFRKGGSAYRFRNIWIKHYLMMRYLTHRFGTDALEPANAAQ